MESARYQLGFLDFLLGLFRWPALLVLTSFVVLAAVTSGPTTAATVGAVLVVALLLRAAIQPAVARLPRSFAVWPDGRFRVRTDASVYDGHLGSTDGIAAGPRSWRIRPSPNMVILVPHRALTPDQRATMAALVAARRAPGARTAQYSTEWWSTMSFQRTLGEVLAFTVRRAGPVLATLAVAFGIVAGMTSHSAVQGVVAGAGVLGAWCVIFTASLARSLRSPVMQGLRIVLRSDGIEVHSSAGSSVVSADLIKGVRTTRSALVFSIGRPFVVPARAFRDDEHRRAFEAGLRRLAEMS